MVPRGDRTDEGCCRSSDKMYNVPMRVPKRRRRNPRLRRVGPCPPETDLDAVAARVAYGGSPYHKDIPSFAGRVPVVRPDASICPRSLAGQQNEITRWLRQAIRSGWFCDCWENGVPLRVWIRQEGVVYEARPTNKGTGEYHGYPLRDDETVKGLP